MDAFTSEMRYFFQSVLSNRHLGKQIKRTDQCIFKRKLVNAQTFGPVTTRLFLNIPLFPKESITIPKAKQYATFLTGTK